MYDAGIGNCLWVDGRKLTKKEFVGDRGLEERKAARAARRDLALVASLHDSANKKFSTTVNLPVLCSLICSIFVCQSRRTSVFVSSFPYLGIVSHMLGSLGTPVRPSVFKLPHQERRVAPANSVRVYLAVIAAIL